MKTFFHKSQSGFSLVETILYFAVAGTLVVIISTTVALALTSRVKSQSIVEVDEAGTSAMQIVTQTLRNAVSVTTPTLGSSGATLSVVTSTSAKNPTVFDLSSGVLRITEGSGQPVALTGNTVTVSNLTFTNLSRSGTPGTIRVSFTITRNNPNNKQEFRYTQNFYGTGTLRQP